MRRRTHSSNGYFLVRGAVVRLCRLCPFNSSPAFSSPAFSASPRVRCRVWAGLALFLARFTEWYWQLDQSAAAKYGRAFNNINKLWLNLAQLAAWHTFLVSSRQSSLNRYCLIGYTVAAVTVIFTTAIYMPRQLSTCTAPILIGNGSCYLMQKHTCFPFFKWRRTKISALLG